MDLEGKKVLLVGLGILGGGLSVAEFFLKNGAVLTITDLRSEEELRETISKLPKNISYTLGEHKESDFESADLIYFNQAVPGNSPWVLFVKKIKKEYFSDYGMFQKYLTLSNRKPIIIGITGTRGKTTVSSWTSELIPGAVLAGNIPEKNLLRQMTKTTDIFVLELSSFQLEYAESYKKAPNIAVFTNLYVDHLNRYGSYENYRDVKFNIFKHQTKNDALILNYDEVITSEILDQKPRAQLYFVSNQRLPKKINGMYFLGDDIYLQNNSQATKVATKKDLAPHEKANLLQSMLAAHLAGVEGKEIVRRIGNLKGPKLRQELIINNKNYEVYNDSAGTSPDATIAAIDKFKNREKFVLITGGTDKELEFGKLSKRISEDVVPENLFLLTGSATDKLIKNLTSILGSTVVAYDSLEEILDIIAQQFDSATIVFSPGAASFEKFKNEFDRGAKFTMLAKKYFSRS